MIHEKTFMLATGRTAKVIVRGHILPTESEIRKEIEVLIKEPKEDSFHSPIGELHPQFWKLKKLNGEQIRLLQIEYSGVTDKQIKKTLKEFEEAVHSSVSF